MRRVGRFTERFRDTETDSDPLCELVEYATCVEIVRQFAQANGPGYRSDLTVTVSHCEGLENEVRLPASKRPRDATTDKRLSVCIRQADCFVGCQYGARTQPIYRFLPEGTDDRFTLKRCRVALHPRCACANEASPPPLSIAPPPPAAFTSEWNLVQHEETRDSSRGSVSALVQRLINGRSLDLSLRSGPMHLYQVRFLWYAPTLHTRF